MYKRFRQWLCKKFNLHADSYFLYFDDKEAESKCRYCDKEIIRPLYSNKWKLKEE